MEEDSVSGGHSQKEWRERFMTTVLQSENEKSTHFNVLTKDKYQQLINEVETAANTDKKTPLQQRRLKRFGVIDIGGVKKIGSRCLGRLCTATVRTDSERSTILLHKDNHSGKHQTFRNVTPLTSPLQKNASVDYGSSFS
ncbi:hypothetical protein J6590_097634 [Homalodisca vitripennis]|nr:hypothetical protein J6590_097634 [Homalodisca vitripennis]